MDATTAHLADFALACESEGLPPEVVHECERRLTDTFGCAIGAYDEPQCAAALGALWEVERVHDIGQCCDP